MKYYVVDAFFIESRDIWGSWTISEIAKVNKTRMVQFIATKTIGGYREIKTGRFIRNADLRMHTTFNRSYGEDGHVYLDKKTVRELDKTGAAIVTCSHYQEELVRPVTDIDEVKNYLALDVAKEAFEKLEGIKKKGREDAKQSKKEEKIEQMEKAKETVREIKKLHTAKVEMKQRERKLSSDIKSEIKKRR